MSKIDNIVIKDGETPPVDHTFAPNGNTGTEANYADRATGISVGYPTIKTTLAQAGRNQPLNKVRIRLAVPKLETPDGPTQGGFVPAPRLAYLGSFDGTFIFHERATKQDRKNVRVYLANLLGHESTVDLIDNLSPAY